MITVPEKPMLISSSVCCSFLGELTRAGSEEGTFHYIRGAQDIQTTMPIIKDLVLACSFLPSMQLFLDTNHTVKIPLINSGQGPLISEKKEMALKGTGFVDALGHFAEMQYLNAKVRSSLHPFHAHEADNVMVGSPY